jgi:hypothetical protein
MVSDSGDHPWSSHHAKGFGIRFRLPGPRCARVGHLAAGGALFFYLKTMTFLILVS